LKELPYGKDFSTSVLRATAKAGGRNDTEVGEYLKIIIRSERYPFRHGEAVPPSPKEKARLWNRLFKNFITHISKIFLANYKNFLCKFQYNFLYNI
jgi:hypothetical protein